MESIKRFGIFFFAPAATNHNGIDYGDLEKYLQTFPSVVKIWHRSETAWTENILTSLIIQYDLTHIILAGALPGTLKALFSKAMRLTNRDPQAVLLASFNEYGISSSRDIDRAKSLLACLLSDIPYEIAVLPEELPLNPATLVIGGGIAGIQAALEIAYSNNLVYLIEKSGTIGGKMATFDKTFPTLDCAACILTPKMVEVNQHPFIRLMTYCEVLDVSGVSGNYSVKILQKARKVNVSTCIGCGTCAEKCPAQAPSEFDFGTTMRKAIYIPFPQAVPNKYMIDADSCIYLKTGKCKACVKACPVPDCIDLDEKDKEIVLEVGNIVVATGYKPLTLKGWSNLVMENFQMF